MIISFKFRDLFLLLSEGSGLKLFMGKLRKINKQNIYIYWTCKIAIDENYVDIVLSPSPD